MQGYKRFSEYSRCSKIRLKRRRHQINLQENDDLGEGDAHVNENCEEHERRSNFSEDSESDSAETLQIIDESESDTDSVVSSDNGADNPRRISREHTPDEEESENSIESIEEDEPDDSSDDDSESAHSNNEDDNDRYNDRADRAQQDNNEPLYEGAPLTTAESLITILNLSLRHNISNKLLSDILRLVNVHCPPDNKCKKTLYKFKKALAESEIPLIRHFYCGNCLLRVEQHNSDCPSCNSTKEITYFIEGPIISQLKALYKRPGFQESLQHRHTRDRDNPGNYEDIYDGAVYKELSEEGRFLANHSNISFTWYTDGIQIYRSSKFNIWPLYLTINELPYAARTKKENILLAGLWFGNKKPVPNLFVEPLRDSIRQLRQGINVEAPNIEDPFNVKGIIICGTCDLPAKALFLNMKQYNGKFGCQKCKQEGVYLPTEHVRIYPFEPLRLRSDEETVEHARQAFNENIAVCGVKGPSVMSTIVHQSMRAISIDVMHCVYEGVAKSLIEFWFSPRFTDHPSSLAEHVRLVDERLRSLTPPSFIQRLPRSIAEHFPYWKANEMKAWLFYYAIVCVNDIMKQVYFEHFKMLVHGVWLLCQSSISPEEVDIASRELREFVCRFEYLYGKKYMTNNVHQLLHLAENVRQFGPLWTASCFPFEDLNGRLKSMVHGSNSAQLQIYSAVSMFLRLTSLKTEILVEGHPANDFCENLESRRGKIKRHTISESVFLVGTCKKIREHPQDFNQVLLEADVLPNETCFYFQRLLKKNVMYSCTEYRRSKRTNSAFVVYSENDNSFRIGKIRCFLRISNCLCPTLCECESRHYAILKSCIVQDQFATCIDNATLSKIHTLIGYENNERAININRLKTVCFYCNLEDKAVSYIIEPVNRVECE